MDAILAITLVAVLSSSVFHSLLAKSKKTMFAVLPHHSPLIRAS